MREILFRGQRTDTKEWILGALVIDWNGNPHIIKENTYGTNIATCDDCGCIEHDSYEVIPETVGQFTGLTDKNGTKIFEGDVISVTFESDCLPPSEPEKWVELYEIVYSNDYYAWYTKLDNGELGEWLYEYDSDCTVIGNIHDSPKLLGGDTQ